MADPDSKYEIISRKEAIARGLKHYFTGDPCKRGHVARRFTNNLTCFDCIYHRNRNWHALNPDKKSQYDKRYREKWKEKFCEEKYRERKRQHSAKWAKANPEKVKAMWRRRYDSDPEKYISLAQTWARRNKDKVREKTRRYYEENAERLREKSREWIKANPEYNREQARKRRAKENKASGSHTKTDVLLILKMQNGRCAYCRTELNEDYTVDHIHPLSRGGSDDPANLQMLCRSCNSRKNSHDPLDFARSLGLLL